MTARSDAEPGAVDAGSAEAEDALGPHALDTVDPGVGRRAALAEAALVWNALLLNRVRLAFGPHEEPDVSIVIVSRDARHLLALTLYRLCAQQGLAGVTFEVILVDNASEPETRALFPLLDGVTIIENATNIGFGPACNAGAARARGRHLLFLNPDIDLMPGALGAMVDAFAAFDAVGIVGARLVFPGGYLQEAGAGFRDDAQLTHPFGRGEADPFLREGAYAREVGYVSGAVLMIARDLFAELNGFDDLFAPAYFEDTDLCARCHQKGRRVIYQPRATAIHFENATSARRADVEALLDRNRGRFRDRHRRWLFETGPRRAGFAARDHDPWRLRVLVVDDAVPHLDLGAGLPRANDILNAMAGLGYAVTFYPVYRGDPEEARRYRDIASTVEILEPQGYDGLARLVAERTGYYDVLWASRPHNINLVCQVLADAGVAPRAFAKSRVIFDSEAVFALRDFVTGASAEGSAIGPALARGTRREAQNFAIADHVVCVSGAEARVLARYGAGNVAVLGHVLHPRAGDGPGGDGPGGDGPDFGARDGFLFVGSLALEGQPNVDSLDWFLDAAWPILRARRPDARLTLVGEVAPAIRARLARPGIAILGRVDDTGPLYDAARVCLAPTRFAAGIPHKVHEAVGRGLPSVITPILAEQMGWPDGSGYLVRDWREPEAFAAALLDLHEEAGTWARVRAAGLARMRAECGPEAYAARLRALCEAPTFA